MRSRAGTGNLPPRVSVLMPVRNGAQYLRAAVDSILAQTFADFEFIIVDDGSDDGTPDIVRQYSRHDLRVALLQQERRGITVALNAGLRAARGQYLARMDADDIAYPHRFERQIQALERDPQLVAVGCWLEHIDPDGDPLELACWPVSHQQIEEQLLQGRNGLPHPAAMIRLDVLQHIGGYREEFPVAQDKDLWLRLGEAGKLANLPEVLLQYRQHLASIGSLQGPAQARCVRAALHAAYQRRGIPLPPHLNPVADTRANADISEAVQLIDRQRVRRRWIRTAIKSGHFATAYKHLRQLAHEKPSSPATWLSFLQLVHVPAGIVQSAARRKAA